MTSEERVRGIFSWQVNELTIPAIVDQFDEHAVEARKRALDEAWNLALKKKDGI